MAIKRRADKILFWVVVTLVLAGFFTFTSASLGLLARDGANVSFTALKQAGFGVGSGSIALILAAKANYRIWKTYSLWLLLASLAATLLVFVPGLGFSHGGATRWIDLGIVTVQPAEFLKLGIVVYYAALLASLKTKVRTTQYGLVPLLLLLALSGGVLAAQPDIGTFLVIAVTAIAMFIGAGCRWRHVAAAVGVLVVAAILLVAAKPYILERVATFVDPSRDPLGAGYQIQQSLIAIGSGELWGRGFGQSVQKFGYLPEPTGDSIFAVAAEEFGFVGSTALIALLLAFAFRGFFLAQTAPTRFGGLLTLGIVILIMSQSFINIASMLGILPLTGMPLLFVSQGGTALFFVLLEAGIILNVSRHRTAS